MCSVHSPGSRGIVICAGGPYLGLAWITLRLLRGFCGSALPVEIWHLAGEVTSASRAAFAAIQGVEFRQLDVALPRRRPGIWAIKPLAVAGSRFQEVLLLDADNVPVADPAPLFDSGLYKETGALFWRDFVRYPDKPGAASALSAGAHGGLPEAILWEQESGQVVVDKMRCKLAMQRLVDLALHLPELARHLPGDGGDKDLFQWSWVLEGCAFAMHPRGPAAAGVEVASRRACPRGPFVGHTMVHHGADGAPMFLHRTIDKHESLYELAWHKVAAARPGGADGALELDRICPDAKIKARIVPRTAAAVVVKDFDDYVPRGRELRRAFDELAAELQRQPWLREAAGGRA